MSVEVGICRCEKVKSRSGLGARDAHNRRTKLVANAHSERRGQNRNLRPDLPESSLTAFDEVQQRIGQPKLRRNGVMGIEYVMTYSPQATGRIDTSEWAKRSLAFVEGRHGSENILSAHLHLDEQTPHVHVIAAPVFAGALVVGPFMGSRGALRKLQNDFFAQVSSGFELARKSENPTGRAHIPARVLRAATRVAAGPIDEVNRRLEAAAAETPIRISVEPVSPMSLLTERGRDAFFGSVERAAESRIIQIRKQILRVAAASLEELRELAMKAEVLRNENITMKRYQLEQMRDIPLEQILDRYLGVFPHREGSSFVAETDDHKIVVTGSKFKDFKSPQGGLGGGAIDLTMHLLGCAFARAIEVLASDFPDTVAGAVRSHHLRNAEIDTATAKASPHRLSFEELRARYAEPEPTKIATVRRYLHEARMIPLPLIDRLVETGDLWANRWGSCVFAHRSLSGDVHGCSIRATVGDFKQTLGPKNAAWFSVGAPPARAARLVITESPIDALSFEALGLRTDDEAILSTAGQAEESNLTAFRLPLVFAQDADEAGEQQSAALATLALLAGLSVERRRPVRGTDWNETLTYDRDQQRRAAREMAERENAIARTLGASSQGDRAPSRGGPNPGLPGVGQNPDTPRRGPVH